MKKELFGVFGDRTEFGRFRSETQFDRVVEGERVTVGIRDVALGIPGRSTTYVGPEGVCVLWGEVYAPPTAGADPAEWLLRRYGEVGADALDELNGSYLAVVDRDGEAFVATDPARTWECYYTDAAGGRLFGTDPAAVADCVPSPETETDALLEFLHLGIVLGDRTTIEQLRRVPFDGYLREDATAELDRFVYEPTEFDYVGELAERLERAMARRAKHPGRKGLLLSGGYDSRTILAGLPNLDACFTVGDAASAEAKVAKKVSDQYGVPHRLLNVDDRYLDRGGDTISYGHGIKESIHIHHAAYDAQIDVDTVYHGLLWDTFFRGHFLPTDRMNVMGYELPWNRLDPDPNVAETLVGEKFGFIPTEKNLVPEADVVGDGEALVKEAVEEQLAGQSDRYDSIHNAIDLVGIRNQPTMPFRYHLADNYLESFIVADRELIDWHLKTPPEYRNSGTLLKAIRRIDPDILQHRPPDRPFDSVQLNTVQGFLRKKLPFVPAFNGSWPDRSRHYDRNQFDQRLFPNCPEIHDLPPRLKLRINDITAWLDETTDRRTAIATDVLCRPA